MRLYIYSMLGILLLSTAVFGGYAWGVIDRRASPEMCLPASIVWTLERQTW